MSRPGDGVAASVLRTFRDRAVSHPQKIAVRDAAGQMTFGELSTRSRTLAARLHAHGVRRGDVAGVWLPRSADLLVGWLGVMAAGAACLPLDPDYPEARLSAMLADSGAGVLVTSKPGPEWARSADVVVLGPDHAATGSAGTEELDEPGADDLAYVLYTSGSTGQPKGVAMEHGPLARLVEWQVSRDGASAAAPTAQFGKVSFDVAFQEIFSTLCGGGTLVIVPDAIRRDPNRLARFLDDHEIVRLFLPTAALHPLADAARRHPPAALRHVFVAGEQMKITPAIRQWMHAAPACQLHNHYGPTETHVVTALVLTGDPDEWPSLPPIGYPLPHVAIALLDAGGHPVPDGEVGELHIGGGCVARGYVNRDQLTAERFVPGPAPLGRCYRTGDLARVTSGCLHFHGRADRQVKIRGYRVEPQEVEVALARHPAVADSLVLAEDDEAGHQRLAAYLVLRDVSASATIDAAAYRRFLLEHLPDFMVPGRWESVAALPTTPSGKVDRSSLSPAVDRRVAFGGDRSDFRDFQAALLDIWSGFLRIPLGLDEDVFDRGATSLLLMEVQQAIHDRLDRDVPVEVLFAHPTVRSLETWFRSQSAAS